MKNVADILGRLRSESMPEPANKVHGVSSLEDMLPDDLSLEIARWRRPCWSPLANCASKRRPPCETFSTPYSVRHDFVTRRADP